MVSHKSLQTIRKQIIDADRDRRFKIQAYAFILNGLDYYRTKTGERRHFTGQELSKGLVEFAFVQFGPFAREVLRAWGIEKTDDFGYIVYNLIDINLIRKQPSDRLEDFFDIVDFDSYFGSQDPFCIDKEYIKSIKGS